jgi:hypothetical protein
MFLGRVSTGETWKNRKIMEGREIARRLASEEFCPGITRRMRQFSVEIRSREEPNAKLDTNAVASLKIGGNTFVTSGKKGPEIHLVRTRRKKSIGIAFFSEDDGIGITKFQTWWASCGDCTLNVLLA